MIFLIFAQCAHLADNYTVLQKATMRRKKKCKKIEKKVAKVLEI